MDTLADEADGSCADGDCSLRDAVQVAGPGDTINFTVGGTLILTLGHVYLDKDLIIDGPGVGLLTISGGNASRVFFIEAAESIEVSISGVTIADGEPPEGAGGGIFIQYGTTLAVSDSAFTGNSASWGGGIHNGGTMTVTHCTFSGNNSRLGGGGIHNDGPGAVIDSIFSRNGDPGTDGGGIQTRLKPLDVTRCTFIGNHVQHGAGIHNRDILYLTDSTFTGNQATGVGGGLYTDDYLSVTNSTFYSNSAEYGGGIYNEESLILTNVTISGNSATEQGGGVFNGQSGAAGRNTIVANSPAGGDCASHLMFSQGNYNNLDTDGSCGSRFTQTTSATLKLAWQGWVLVPISGSVAIDAGSNSECPATDQLGRSRPQDGDDNGSAICDIGSIEVVLMRHRIHLPVVLQNAP